MPGNSRSNLNIRRPAGQYHDRISELSNSVGGFTSGVGDYESLVNEDFDTSSSHYHNLRMIELGQCAGDIVYLDWSNCSGDNGMVKHWSELGFVVRRTFVSSDQPDAKASEAYVETERNGLEGLEYRDFYYMLGNIDQFPQMYEFSSKIVNQFLGVARRAIEHQTYPDLAPSSWRSTSTTTRIHSRRSWRRFTISIATRRRA